MKDGKKCVDAVYFEINTMCNLKCIHCFNRSGSTNDSMNFETFKRVADTLNNEQEMVFIIAGGEPLLHPEITIFLDYLKNLNAKVSVVTNGILADKILTPYLLSEDAFSIQISLDGATSATNAFVRGEGHFEKAIKYMQYLHEQGYQYGLTRMTINKVNYTEIEEFFMLALSTGFFPTYSFVMKSGLADDNWDQLNIDFSERIKAISLINRLYKQYRIEFSYIKEYETLSKMNIQPTTICSLTNSNATMKPLIKVNGDVQPCQRLYDNLYCIGNITEQDIDDICNKNNDRLTLLHSLLNNRKNILKLSRCKNCIINELCEAGCPGRSIDCNGNILEIDSDCSFRKKEFIVENLRFVTKNTICNL